MQPELFDPITFELSLAIVAPDQWVIEQSDLDTVIEQWQKNL